MAVYAFGVLVRPLVANKGKGQRRPVHEFIGQSSQTVLSDSQTVQSDSPVRLPVGLPGVRIQAQKVEEFPCAFSKSPK